MESEAQLAQQRIRELETQLTTLTKTCERQQREIDELRSALTYETRARRDELVDINRQLLRLIDASDRGVFAGAKQHDSRTTVRCRVVRCVTFMCD